MHTNNNANLKHPTLASIAHHSTTLKNRQIHYDLWPQVYVGDFI